MLQLHSPSWLPLLAVGFSMSSPIATSLSLFPSSSSLDSSCFLISGTFSTVPARRGVNLALKMKRDMIIKNLDLKPTIDAMMRDIWSRISLEMSPTCIRNKDCPFDVVWNISYIVCEVFAVLPGGKNRARKRVARSSHVVMDPARRHSS
ncbi:hypothetical protein Tco_0588346 [Tanacetum coccineum]